MTTQQPSPPGSHHTLPTPNSGDDATFEILDHAIAALGLHRGLWMGDDRNMIHLVASIIDQAERCLPHLVTEARDDGCTWHDIAQLLAITPDQAQHRFDPTSPTADTRPMFNIDSP